jgi:hypothetical protein
MRHGGFQRLEVRTTHHSGNVHAMHGEPMLPRQLRFAANACRTEAVRKAPCPPSSSADQ